MIFLRIRAVKIRRQKFRQKEKRHVRVYLTTGHAFLKS